MNSPESGRKSEPQGRLANPTEAEVVIRSIIEDDVDAVIALAGSLIKKEEIVALGPGGKFDLSFVAEAGGRIVGYILARMVYLGIPLSRICTIYGIIVDHEYRRQGIGDRLVSTLAERCKQQGIQTVRALVDENDTELCDFARELGFRRSPIANYDRVLY
ncbi:MAG: GNAT family N-acetyltransferase [Chloroflexi bacterium]|nr:GNAT family N-acetyltransferase [Chloroflexota bacterium]